MRPFIQGEFSLRARTAQNNSQHPKCAQKTSSPDILLQTMGLVPEAIYDQIPSYSFVSMICSYYCVGTHCFLGFTNIFLFKDFTSG